MVDLTKTKTDEKVVKVDPTKQEAKVEVKAEKAQTTEVATKKELPPSLRKQLNESLIEYEKEFKRVLPAHVSADRFLRICQSEITKNPLLLECSRVSFLGSVMLSAQLGLEIGAHLGHAYLIPYKKEASLQFGYKGLLELVRRSDKVAAINVQNVYENDTLELDPLNNHVLFKPLLKGDRGAHYLTVAVALMKDGTKHIDWMSKEQIDKRRGVAQTRKVWDAWYERMAEKTVLKSLCRLLPMSVEDMRRVNADERIVNKLAYGEEIIENSDSIYEINPELQDNQKEVSVVESVEETKSANAAEALFDDKK